MIYIIYPRVRYPPLLSTKNHEYHWYVKVGLFVCPILWPVLLYEPLGSLTNFVLSSFFDTKKTKNVKGIIGT